jgi:lysine 2,3-aminomutase
LVECRIKPYYLHHSDLAPGTSHLRTEITTGQELMRSLRGSVSGLCQPTYVLDIPGGHGKSPIGPNYINYIGSNSAAHFVVEDVKGQRHQYPAHRLMSNRQEIEQGRRHRERGEADKHHRDHGVPDKGHVAPER